MAAFGGGLFMPVSNSHKTIAHDGCECGNGRCGCGCSWGCKLGKKILLTLLGVLLVYMIFYVGTLMRNNIKKYYFIGQADKSERTIMVSGFGKITGNNDVAVTTLGYSNTDKDVAKAQSDNKAVMDKVYADLKAMGVEDRDVQTDYRVYPDYNYTQDKGQVLNGYKIENKLTIKIRDLTKTSGILGLVGKYGLTEVAGLSYTIDDSESLKALARTKALANAKLKAQELANDLGVNLGSVVSYNEYEGSNSYYPMKAMAVDAVGMGGISSAPADISSGSQDVVINVNVVYEIAPQTWW